MRFAALLLLALSTPAQARLDVVTTLPDLAALAREVGGDAVQVTALVATTQDPHYVDPRPSYVLALNQAALVVVNGLELESAWLDPLLLQARNPAILKGGSGYVDASTAVARLEVPASIDRSQGDIHPGGNPHYLFDPRAGAAVAGLLAQRFAAADPAQAAGYAERGQALQKRLLTLAAAQRARFDTLPAERRRVVVYHQSLTYLFDWLGLQQVITVEPKPGISPDPAHTAKVLQAMKAGTIKVILQEAFYPAKISETLTKLVGGQVVRLAGGAREDETYEVRIATLAETIHAALR